jgi:hypothetical protein
LNDSQNTKMNTLFFVARMKNFFVTKKKNTCVKLKERREKKLNYKLQEIILFYFSTQSHNHSQKIKWGNIKTIKLKREKVCDWENTVDKRKENNFFAAEIKWNKNIYIWSTDGLKI